MSVEPVLTSGFSTFSSQTVFRAMLTCLSRPGSVVALPFAIGAALVPLALADVETTVAVVGDAEAAELVVRATGAAVSRVEDAELVACCGRTWPSTIERLAPELGAKVGIDCERLVAGGVGGGRGGEVTLRLSGPDGTALLGVDGVDAAVFEAVAAANAAPPAGIDVWLVDRAGRLAGIPRSCHLEVR